MISERATNRRRTFFLILTVVLFLGLVQWSFLPLLIDSGLPSSSAVVGMSAGHTSKFAAPFKCLFGDPLNACLLPSGVSAPKATVNLVHRLEPTTSSRRDERFLSNRLLRAPPSA